MAIFRPDLFASAATALGLSVPAVWVKSEGSHSAAWLLPAAPTPIPMGPDRFMDGAYFDPANFDRR
jgi:nitrate/nitrite transport system substrate-binding protein